MKKILFFVLALAASASQAQSLTAIEGVEYDPTNQIFLVGNGNNVVRMHSDAIPQGTLGAAKSNYGMEVMNGVLFSIVGSAVRGYDVTTGAQVMTITLSGTTFLNGMASNGTDKLWVSDFSAKKIHEVNVADLAAPSSYIVVAAEGAQFRLKSRQQCGGGPWTNCRPRDDAAAAADAGAQHGGRENLRNREKRAAATSKAKADGR